MSNINDFFEFDKSFVIEEKICVKCKKSKPFSQFPNHGGTKYLRTECRECAYQLNKERTKLRKTAPKLPENYICPICKKQEHELEGRGGKNSPTFVLDHDHDSKKFRGYLCQSCNRALGMFYNKTLLSNAINYLKISDV